MRNRFKQIRQHGNINLSQETFGKRLGVTGAAISRIESGSREPSEQILLAVCREFNVNEDWLRTGKGEMFKKSKDATVDQLAAEYGLDDLGRQIMSAYLDLDENDRLAVGRLIQKIVDERMNAVATGKDVPAPVVDTKIETTAHPPRQHHLSAS